jgi:putative tryptophan/tyrosine transport system ATP-binding protein
MLRVESVQKTFARGTPNAKQALAGVTFALDVGEFAVIIGGNGAGKSTLLNAVAGSIKPDQGEIWIAGVRVTQQREDHRARVVGRVFQDPMVGTAPSLTVEENVALAEMRGSGAGLRQALTPARRERYRDHLAPLKLGLEDRLTTVVGTLSGGQRQSLALAMATIATPSVLLLDEHTAALDPGTAEIVLGATIRLVAEARLTALMVTHNMRYAIDAGSRVIMMDAGTIRADISGPEKGRLSVEDLVARFRMSDDKLLLSR